MLGPTQCVRGEGGKLLDRSIHLVVVVVVAFAVVVSIFVRVQGRFVRAWEDPEVD